MANATRGYGSFGSKSAFAAYLIVCVVWGSTYLAIRIGVAVMPPFLFAGLRFVTAGALLLAGALAFGDGLPRRAQDWRTLAVVGTLLLAGGNSLVVWAEQYTPSGVASVFVVTVALWMSFFDAVVPGGRSRLTGRILIGLAVGLVGTSLLVGLSPTDLAHADLRGPVALTIASACWSLGSIYAKRHPTTTSPYVSAAVEMLCGGTVAIVLGTVQGEWHAWAPSTRGFEAMAYLVVFGSIVGYSAYGYALRHASPTVVGTYAYVNPIIAVLLGRIVLGEPVTSTIVVAMALILGAVVWIHAAVRGGTMTATRDAVQQADRAGTTNRGP
ncbi:MAG TPA: EamA family transporter [Gemmatimonadales bacterium]|nr:EamA family transporter [Gemmatimonadales bacterium]